MYAGHYPGAWRYDAANMAPGGANVGYYAVPNAAAQRGEYMVKEAAAHGAAAFARPQPPQPPQQMPPPPPQPAAAPQPPVPGGPRGRRGGRGDDANDGITPKITGNNPVLPARRKAEILERQMQLQQQQQQVLVAQQPAEPEAPKRSPDEQREHDAMAKALRQELASTALHMATLEQRRARLVHRLYEMGEEP